MIFSYFSKEVPFVNNKKCLNMCIMQSYFCVACLMDLIGIYALLSSCSNL